MGSIKVIVRDETEESFRRAAMKRFGYGKGAISEAAEQALREWASRTDFDLSQLESGDPVGAIEGMLKGTRGSSVDLQHEAGKIRARRAVV